jgi:hypothetical protein
MTPGIPGADSNKVGLLWLAFYVPDRHRPDFGHHDLRCRPTGRYYPLAPALPHQEYPDRLQRSSGGAHQSLILVSVPGASALVEHHSGSVSDEQSGLDR